MNNILLEQFKETRKHTESLCQNLAIEDYSVQPVNFVSPPKWHLAHTSWFFEQFLLTTFSDYKVYNEEYSFLFNSYYNNVGDKLLRSNRGVMTRPTVSAIYDYRAYVSKHIIKYFDRIIDEKLEEVLEIGINHEQQHQELLVYDIKYIFGNQSLFPAIDLPIKSLYKIDESSQFITVDEGVYEIGHQANDFCFDNELGVHKVYLHQYEIANQLVSNKEYTAFIEDGGYENFNLWHDDGWRFINENKIKMPLYWYNDKGNWKHYTINGLKPIDENLPVTHLSFYEAFAFAQWKGMRLPTEFEWEVASERLNYGELWEWTGSAYLPYPNYTKPKGAIGEYNGKFMVNQHVLRGGSVASPKGHVRKTYRNYFHPNMQWMFSGLRLVKK